MAALSRGRWLAAVVLATLGGAAGCESSAEVIVEVHTDLEPGVDFDEALAVAGAARARDDATSTGFLAAGVRLPALRVPVGPVELTASLRGGGRTVVSRSLAVRAEGTVVVPVWLVRGCIGLVCPTGGVPENWSECDGGRCVAPDCVPTEITDCAPDACEVDGDCPAASADCAAARCDRGNCTLAPVLGACATDEYCDPASGCRARDAGVDAGRAVDGGGSDAPSGCGSGCDDGNGCTDDACSAGTCTHTPNGAGCSDGNACTHGDRCAGGSCSGTAYSCPAPACMTASCDGSGGCTTGGGCGGGTVCDGSGCVPCGGADQRCCEAGGCNSGLWCFGGVCSCGQPGGPCCPWDSSCAAGSCGGGTCPSCLPDGSPCGSLPCCGTSRCASGICFPF